MADYVTELLKERGIPYNFSGRDVLVKCLNPDHDDSNPSLRIDKDSGAFHCFACGFKGNLFKFFGILTNQSFLKVIKLKQKLEQLQIDRTGLEIPPVAIPYTRPYRGISTKTLREFEAFYLPSDSDKLKGYEDRIIFPIKDISGKITNFIGRHMLSDGDPRYLIYPSQKGIPIYPNRFARGTKSVVLVEGIFDMLNCYDKGMTNTICVFGTNTLQKDTKDKLLPLKMQGIEKVYIMFDGDEAGRKAMKIIEPLVQEQGFQTEIIPLEDDSDPGELSQEYVDSIREYVNAENSFNRQST